MEQEALLKLLIAVKDGHVSPKDVLDKLKVSSMEDLGYAVVDHSRGLRQGTGEVIYGEGKTTEQIAGILDSMKKRGTKNILVTRLSPEKADDIGKTSSLDYDPISRMGIVDRERISSPVGSIVVASAGTSDMPVCEEAALTAEALGSKVTRMYDVGVAGLHRLLSKLDVLSTARVLIVVAGMEGALASVVGGLVDCPVIAVPTSVGYGANFGGMSALLSMLNSCASGVSVVNIDNGFGAGFLANRINRMEGLPKEE